MKTLTLATLAIILGTSTAQATSIEALQAVLKNKEIKATFTDIQSIREFANDRCPDCYSLEIHGSNSFGSAYAKALTERVDAKTIKVSVFEKSR